MAEELKIAVVGLGYVGLPLAEALSISYPRTMGFDFECRLGAIGETSFGKTSDVNDLRGADVFIVVVPTPIDKNKRPDLSHLESACKNIGSVLEPGAIVVFESTVYPGVTEEFCKPILLETSGLTAEQIRVGYSPERINPGDPVHTIENIVKVIAAEDEQTLTVLKEVYGSFVSAGLHKASSIQVAEAAKVIENTQRDLNIALMNELAVIFDKLEISTTEVLEAASTKWNFNKYHPGLVGGHCIGVDPYYLTSKAEELGYRPQVILAGRRINDGMGKYVAQKTVKLLVNEGITIKGSRVGIFGVTFKENIDDIRNSRVPDIASELNEFGIEVLVSDPYADTAQVNAEYGFDLTDGDSLQELDGLILAVPHKEYIDQPVTDLLGRLKRPGVFIDVKSVFRSSSFDSDIRYWSL